MRDAGGVTIPATLLGVIGYGERDVDIGIQGDRIIIYIGQHPVNVVPIRLFNHIDRQVVSCGHVVETH